MQVGDLVKWKRDMFRESAPVGIALIEGGSARWTILWTSGRREIVSEQNLLVVKHASR